MRAFQRDKDEEVPLRVSDCRPAGNFLKTPPFLWTN